MSFPATFKVGDLVRVFRTNEKALRDPEWPKDDDGNPCDYVGEFESSLLGAEITIMDYMEYDDSDNSWLLGNKDGDFWVHELALELVRPLTQEEEDAAIASIRATIASIVTAIAPKHLALTEDGYRRNAEDCPACIPNLDKMPYPFICPGPET